MGNQIVGLEDETDAVVTVCVPILCAVFFGGAAVNDEVAFGIAVQTDDNVL